MQDESNVVKVPHNLVLEDRKLLSISGVNDIDSFDESIIVLFTEMGELTVKGNNLHISKLNVDTGELTMDGLITAIVYHDEEPTKASKGLLSKVFK